MRSHQDDGVLPGRGRVAEGVVAVALEQPLLDVHQVAAGDARKLNLQPRITTRWSIHSMIVTSSFTFTLNPNCNSNAVMLINPYVHFILCYSAVCTDVADSVGSISIEVFTIGNSNTNLNWLHLSVTWSSLQNTYNQNNHVGDSFILILVAPERF